MKQLLTVLCLNLFVVSVYAQSGQMTKASESDPKAKAILDEIRKRFESYTTMEANFELEIEFPGNDGEVQKGTVSRQGDKYKVDMGTQSVLSDGKAVYLIMHYNKEVQINSMPEDGDEGNLLSPQSLLSFYDNAEFVYALANEMMENGRAIQQIEFKPVDRNADYSKVRLTVDKNTKDVIRVRAFAKDGSRYTFRLNDLKTNKTYPANYFAFDKSKYNGYYIEDLRE